MPLLYYDNSRISTYRECNRKFLLRHQFDLVSDFTKIDLIFGQCWHESMNVVWKFGSDRSITNKTLVEMAMLAFTKKWVEEGLQQPTLENFQTITDKYVPKTPWIALEMLGHYVDERRPFIQDCTEIDVERPFAVPLGLTIPIANPNGSWTNEEVLYIGRLDKCVKHRRQGRIIVEHKTTGWYAKEGGFRSDYIESFSPNSQVDGYLFAGNSIYQEGVKAVWVDAALTHKTVHDKFKYIPIEKQFAMLDQWLAETKVWVKRIVQEQVEFVNADPQKPLTSFPKNTGSCHMYSGCTYRDICRFVPDPRNLKLPPPGYVVERWEPFDLLRIGEILGEKKGE